MKRGWVALLWFALCAAPLHAQQAEFAQTLERLSTASAQLATAQGREDRVQAITQGIKALEQGLSDLRGHMRAAKNRETQLRENMTAREGEIRHLIGALQTLSRAPEPTQLLHPMGPTGSARAAMMVSDVTRILNEQAMILRQDVEDITTIVALQERAQQTLSASLTDLQNARAALARAVSDRTPLPQRFVEDAERMQRLLNSSETLTAFADGLLLEQGAFGQNRPPQKGTLRLPAQGRVAQEFDRDHHRGITLQTPAGALVTPPVAATVRYAGPLLDYGQVVILEPTQGMLIVLAGLETLYVSTGQILGDDAPIGLMGHNNAGTRAQSLYIELRNGQVPIDPLPWFEM